MNFLMNADLEVFVINSGQGEFIVLKFAADKYGIIDFYDSSSLDYANAIIPPSASIEFLSLTHPHFDHYHNMGRFITQRNKNIHRFWRYPGITKKEIIARYLNKPLARGCNKNDLYLSQARTDFCHLWKSIDKYKSGWGNDYQQISQPKLTKYYSFDNGTIFGISPLQQDIDNFNNFLSDPKLPFQEQGAKSENMICYFLMVQFYDYYLFFLADIILKSTWVNIVNCLNEYDVKWNNVIYVKCSHHGSKSGWNNAFIRKLNGIKHMTITCFSRHGLPEPAMVEKYSKITPSLTVVSNHYQQRKDRAKSYQHLTNQKNNCDHINISSECHLKSDHINV